MRDFWKFIKKTPLKADLYTVFDEEGADITPPLVDFMLNEDGSFILNEDGTKIRLTL